jgi:glyoxylase-like metal-dependent hydrolase (beta-lactamase superfamily II)
MPDKTYIQLVTLPLGPWQTNCFILTSGRESLIIDPAAEPTFILRSVGGTDVRAILLTHAHPDHVGALDAVREATGAPVGVHPADAETFGIRSDFDLVHGMDIPLGNGDLIVAHTPGHTPGSVCFRFDSRAVVGDTLFPGGPGHSDTPEALAQILTSLEETLFTWHDEVYFMPGHGAGSTIGAVRPAYEAFLGRPRPSDLCGDVEWA